MRKEANKMKKSFYQLKVVKTRKEHKCSVCEEVIPKEARALVENGFNRDDGFFSNYFHIQLDREYGCQHTYLDACQPNDLTIPNKLRDESFYGELMYNRWKETI